MRGWWGHSQGPKGQWDSSKNGSYEQPSGARQDSEPLTCLTSHLILSSPVREATGHRENQGAER